MKTIEHTLDLPAGGSRGLSAWPARAIARLRAALAATLARHAEAREQQRTWRLLHSLNDAELRDIGLKRGDLPWLQSREQIGDHRDF
jgi:uncharacterized protein YjiS (DUF1127 family)